MVTREDMRDIAEAAAEKTVAKLFLTLGVNTSDPDDIKRFQKDLNYLNGLRESTEAVKKHSLRAGVSFMVTAALGAVWLKWHG